MGVGAAAALRQPWKVLGLFPLSSHRLLPVAVEVLDWGRHVFGRVELVVWTLSQLLSISRGVLGFRIQLHGFRSERATD